MRPVLMSGLMLLCLTSAAPAATYVVTTTGSDSNPGTSAKPFRTINRAARIAGPGDRVLVRPGTYREAVLLRRSGTKAKPISFIADPAGKVVVTGADVIKGWRRLGGGAPIYEVPWSHLFVGEKVNGHPVPYHPKDEPLWGRAEQVIVGGRQLLQTLDLKSLRSAWAKHIAATAKGAPRSTVPSPLPHLGGPFAGCFAADVDHKRLYLWLADGSDPNRHQVQAATRGQIFATPRSSAAGVQYVQLSGFIFRYAASFPQNPAINIFGQHNLIDNCVIDQMAGAGVIVCGTLRRCLIEGCGHTGGTAWGNNYVNDHCIWEGNSWKPIDRDWEAGALKSVLNHNGLFRQCAFIRNGGPGIWFDINEVNTLVTDCLFEDNEGPGIFVEISKGIRVVNNLCIGNATGAVGTPHPGWSCAGITIAESEDCLVEGNTCVGNKDGIAFREQGPREVPVARGSTAVTYYHCTGDIVRSNICAFNKGYPLAIWSDNDFFGPHPGDSAERAANPDLTATGPTSRLLDPAKQDITIDNNLYYANGGAVSFLYGAPWRPRHEAFSDLASFRGRTGFDRHSRVADPLFVDAPAGDYRLQPRSPAKAMGAGWAEAPADLARWVAGLRTTKSRASAAHTGS